MKANAYSSFSHGAVHICPSDGRTISDAKIVNDNQLNGKNACFRDQLS